MLIKEFEYNSFLKKINSYVGVLVHGADRGKVNVKISEIISSLRSIYNNSLEVINLSLDDLSNSKGVIYETIYQKSFFNSFTAIRINLDLIKLDNEFLNIFTNLDTNKSNFILLESDYIKNNSPVLKLFTSSKTFACLPCYHETNKSIKSKVQKYIDEFSIKIDADTFNYLCSKLGNDSLITKNELKKLSLFSKSRLINYETVLNAVGDNSAFNIFKLCDNVGVSKIDEIEALYYKTISNGVTYIAIIRSLLSHFQRLLEAKSKNISNIKELYKSIHFSRHENINKQLSTLKLQEIKEFIAGLYKVEIDAKLNPSLSNIYVQKLILSIYNY